MATMRALVLALTVVMTRAELSIVGSWQDPFGTSITISTAAYVSIYQGGAPSVVKITHYDNAQAFLVGHNSGAGSYYPGKWSRLDWLYDSAGALHLCTSHYTAENETMAMQPNPSNNHSLYASTGCGGFAFSALTPPQPAKLAISGSWTDPYATSIEISSTVYISTYPGSEPAFVKITYYDNVERFFVGENSGPGSYNPGMWTRVDWVVDMADQVHVCTTHFSAANESMAMLPNEGHDHALYDTTGCGGFAFSALSPAAADALQIVGSWQDPFGTSITISTAAYVSIYQGGAPSVVKITHYDNAQAFLVGHNSGAGSYYPGKWSRLDWLYDSAGALHLCTSHYTAENETMAMQPNPSNNHSLYASTGCGGFAFSALTPPQPAKLAISGSWTDPYATSIEISSTVYISTYPGSEPAFVKITYYDNVERFFVGENSGPGSYNPGMWTRVDWVVDMADQVHVCTTHFSAANESMAMLPNEGHDHALYDTTGCGGFAFSALSKLVAPPGVSDPPGDETEDEGADGISSGAVAGIVIGSLLAFASVVAVVLHATGQVPGQRPAQKQEVYIASNELTAEQTSTTAADSKV